MATVSITPDPFYAMFFDLDGVLRDTASVRAAAWRQLFDNFLKALPIRPGEAHAPFTGKYYRRYVDGRSGFNGARTFLSARGIGIDDRAVHELGDRKDRFFHTLLARDRVRVFPSSMALVSDLKIGGWHIAVISASRNRQAVLVAVGLDGLFEVRVDGIVAHELGLAGKPDPPVLLEAARRLGVPPDRAVLVEDALAGIEAARRSGFALVVGVERTGPSDELQLNGADVVVSDLREVAVSPAVADGVGT